MREILLPTRMESIELRNYWQERFAKLKQEKESCLQQINRQKRQIKRLRLIIYAMVISLIIQFILFL